MGATSIFVLTTLIAAFIPQPPVVFGSNVAANADQTPMDVSLVALIANPRQYHARIVQITGAFRIEREETPLDASRICIHRDDVSYHLDKNCFQLRFGPDFAAHLEELIALNSNYVRVTGRFDMNSTGYSDRYSGAIVDIWRVEDYSAFAEWLDTGPQVNDELRPSDEK